MKLLKKDRRVLEGILSGLRTGRDYVLSDEIALMLRTSLTSDDMFRSKLSDGAYIPIDKQIGSKWTVLLTAIRRLEELLEGPADVT